MTDAERRRRVEDMCDAALHREARERAAFVAAACGRDEALRQEVEALLAHAQTAEGFLAAPIGAVAANVLGDQPGASLVGTQVGAYRIVSHLGAGGMGEVYRARDTKLGRDVAIKVLPASVLHNPERRARFEREARLLASLNHPNIAAIYGFEKSGGTHALVMELVEGDDLSQRIARGAIPLDEALPIARQIAEALEAAHEHGIVHRDLKPANIKITPDGAVKVLDFGLAKAIEGPVSVADISQSATLSAAATRAGVILGTAAYMSPEQARGKTVDKRADIWAFGCVLYEMLTARSAFAGGETLSDTIAAILERQPDWGVLPDATPESVRRLLQRCLEKDSKRRLRDIGDVGFQIEEARNEAVSPAAAIARVRKGQERVRWMTAIFVLVAATIVTALYFRRSPVPQGGPPVARLIVAPSPGVRLGTLSSPALAISADGTQLAYVGVREGTQQLYLRSLAGLDSNAISGTEVATNPFFSPNGQWIGFFAQGKLKKVPVSGGPVQILSDAPQSRGGTWGPDDTIYFAPTFISGLWKVSAVGGTPTEVTRLNRSRGEVSHRWPQVLPGGKAVLFTVWTGPGADERHIELQSLETGERRTLVQVGDTGRYVSSGHLVYARADVLMAVPTDLSRFEISGSAPVRLLEEVRVGAEGAHYAVSDFGQLIYVPGDPRRYERRLVWVDRRGNVEPLAAPRRDYANIRMSPNGRQAAVEIWGGTIGIWIYDFVRTTLTPLTSAGSSQSPTWTPDGKSIVYRGSRKGFRSLFWKAVDGTREEERLIVNDNVHTPASWSPDGKWLAFHEIDQATNDDIWMLRLDGDRKPQPFLRTGFAERNPRFSPDGKWIAYESSESGRREVYVQPFPGPGGKRLISTEGGREPVWSRNGRELFYVTEDKLMVVDVATQPAFSAGSPRLLFEGRYIESPNGSSGYDVSPDGQRFLRIQAANPEPPADQINVVLNWFEELKRLVPTK